uniref:Uncharacterized protein n=1 Tax=Scophthalmus maximus TaxID=52904 RepID=A0A8D3BA72_SCOMX
LSVHWTLIMMLAVPERGGTPPSTAVRIKLWTECSSRSKLPFSTKSTYLEPSLPVCMSMMKYLLSLR